MEIDTPNALSQVLDEVCEEWGGRVAQVLGGDSHPDTLELNVSITLIVAGVQHLLVRARRTEMWSGIPDGAMLEVDALAQVGNVHERITFLSEDA